MAFSKPLIFFVFALLPFTTANAKDTNFSTTSIYVKDKKQFEFASLAKIKIQEAMKIAVKKTTGKVIEAALVSHENFLIYEIDVVLSNSSSERVLIDAGNGKILQIQKLGYF